MAVIEAPAGVALVCLPSPVAELLLGAGLDSSAAIAVGRVAGVALLTIGIACWLAHYDSQSRAARGLVGAMLVYNLGVAVVLAAAGIISKQVGVLLWPAVVLHLMMTVWCVACLLRNNKLTTRDNPKEHQ